MFDAKSAADSIVGWLKQQLEASKAKGFVLGLSGGLDSSVAAVLAKRATDRVLGLLLPCGGALKDVGYALKLAGKFSIETKSADLVGMFDVLCEQLPKGSQLGYGNIKPRLRMIILYYYANLNNYLVLGTSNKTELSIGYFTKYGDGACDIAPLGDLYKYQVVAVARELDITEEIIRRAPSAGLWVGQTDEAEIGLTYAQMDPALEAIERGQTEGFDPTVVEKLRKMIKQSDHKRQVPRICKLG
jgi:NAD+ synthase